MTINHSKFCVIINSFLQVAEQDLSKLLVQSGFKVKRGHHGVLWGFVLRGVPVQCGQGTRN